MSDDDIKFGDFSIGDITISTPTRKCPVHGDINGIEGFMYFEHKPENNYCYKCIEEFMDKHLPKLEED